MKKKIDKRITDLINYCSITNERSVFIIVGDNAREQIPNLHYLYSQSNSFERLKKLEILWCYKKELDLSNHQQKELNKSLKSQLKGNYNSNSNTINPFSEFIRTSSIQRIKYDESYKVLGKTYGILILQDFQAITPNLLCRTIETVQGGGLIIFLFNNMSSLKQLHSIVMDFHHKLHTSNIKDVYPRFNDRFIKSLIKDNPNFLALDSEFNVLDISKNGKSAYLNKTFNTEEKVLNSNIDFNQRVDDIERDVALKKLKDELKDNFPVGKLVDSTKTLDQAKCVMQMIDSIADKKTENTVSIFAGRGRGKSAAMGLAIASAVVYGYTNVFVTAPSPENLQTFFEFLIKGLECMNYKQSKDFDILKGVEKDLNKQIIRVSIKKNHNQVVSYISPTDYNILSHCDLLVIDEAAAIPLSIVKELMINCLIFMASTVQGYEGTGRSLSLKLIQNIKESKSRNLHQIELEQAIRYADNDPIENWLNKLLCLDSVKDSLTLTEYPSIEDCELYLVDKDTLFSYKNTANEMLNSIMGLFITSHYKNTPNDLQLISDSATHSIYILTKSYKKHNYSGLPEILCVIQVAEEGGIDSDTIKNAKNSNNLPAGDLIPWTLSNYYLDNQFPKLSGARIVRIATNPHAQRMGYGKRALDLLYDYYSGNLYDINKLKENNEEENINENNKKKLLYELTELKPSFVYYLGTSFGITLNLFRFWKSSGYIPLYIKTLANSITGEYSCIMIKSINLSSEEIKINENSSSITSLNWIDAYSYDFSRRMISLLSYEFKNLRIDLAYELLGPLLTVNNTTNDDNNLTLFNKYNLDDSKAHFKVYFTKEDFKRLQKYTQGLANVNLIHDLIPSVAKFFILKKVDKSLSLDQAMILIGIGLQKKDFIKIEYELDTIKKEKIKKNTSFNKSNTNNNSFGIDQNSVMGMFKKTIIKFTDSFRKIIEDKLMDEEKLNQDNKTLMNLKLNVDEQDKENIRKEIFEKDEDILNKEKEVRTNYYKDKFGGKKRKKSID